MTSTSPSKITREQYLSALKTLNLDKYPQNMITIENIRNGLQILLRKYHPKNGGDVNLYTKIQNAGNIILEYITPSHLKPKYPEPSLSKDKEALEKSQFQNKWKELEMLGAIRRRTGYKLASEKEEIEDFGDEVYEKSTSAASIPIPIWDGLDEQFDNVYDERNAPKKYVSMTAEMGVDYREGHRRRNYENIRDTRPQYKSVEEYNKKRNEVAETDFTPEEREAMQLAENEYKNTIQSIKNRVREEEERNALFFES